VSLEISNISPLNDLLARLFEEEETDLFPKVRKVLDAEDLQTLGQEIKAEQVTLENKGKPRAAIPAETDHAATLP